MQDKTSASATEATTWLAVALVFAGWFLLNTFHVEWGPFARNLRFFDIPSVIEIPSRLFTGVKERSTGTVLFGLICGLTLVTPVLPRLWRHPQAWLGMITPSVLIVLCIVLLYARTFGHEPQSGSDTIANDLRHLGHHVLENARNGMGRRVTLAPGAYVAALGSFYLAMRGITGYRKIWPLRQGKLQ